jgi:hypothetical protein
MPLLHANKKLLGKSDFVEGFILDISKRHVEEYCFIKKFLTSVF